MWRDQTCVAPHGVFVGAFLLFSGAFRWSSTVSAFRTVH
ncbi:hypothetical protein K60_019470 [Mycobacterium tuberculosis variant bovis BCG str. Korea 1168P]|uniref:Uncharacterized protein n=1 Tax=Mycobacterium tuberculosis (strain CDC 1551 / Oshkosh) TaxID=83331 RepID=Q8VJV6_MYCTO|nr:hypothetical protein MT1909 [Mycobacterium tuberculosis CDC1551]AGE67857.1 hypothetical protein K60_019470 [Mycobacterium tuberculosis variant bovis BCG str. Korea 1168P]AHM07612.1 hypothetical protein BCGT_1692 [Mycobacterium tuberculosis variant bovis BCG str. ATCC 35743]ALA78354.1 putative membrane protein [Mycobacterium tuberculosis variant bovis BCG]ALB19022.1 Hypothetical protein AFL40_1922 [Mycobacterium tuberculosis]EFD13496.1 conserved hypothetical protein [Mycobacterium tuberculos